MNVLAFEGTFCNENGKNSKAIAVNLQVTPEHA